MMAKGKNERKQEQTPEVEVTEIASDVKDQTVSAVSAEVADLQKQLEDAQNKAHEYLDGWQRARADFANYKKRVERDQLQTYQNAAGNILKRYLAAVDDMERALKNRPNEGEGAKWSGGIELIYRKMVALLESEGVTPMNVLGEMFDPNLHEAILTEDTDQYESGQITEVLQQGYLLGDKVLRPAMVRVAR